MERRDDEPLIYTDIEQVKEDYAKDIVRTYTTLQKARLPANRFC